MNRYNREELADMIFILGEAERNCLLASRIYAQRYPDRRHPDSRSLKKLLKRFQETGGTNYKKPNKSKSVRTEENTLSVMLAVNENPSTSQREVSEIVGISERSVQRTLKELKYHGYHIQLHQELIDADFEKRVNFCQWARDKLRQDNQFYDRVLFSDESTFHKNGFPNRHNLHYYSDRNPRILRTVDTQHKWSINVWGGIIGENVIGPYFFNGHLNGGIYLDFLRDTLPRLLQNLPEAVRQVMWIQHDGAPAHYSRQVRDYLNNVFPDKWIGRNGPVQWPPRSPDLTSLDFFYGDM